MEKQFNSDETIEYLISQSIFQLAYMKTLRVCVSSYVAANSGEEAAKVFDRSFQEQLSGLCKLEFEHSPFPQAFASDAVEQLLKDLRMRD